MANDDDDDGISRASLAFTIAGSFLSGTIFPLAQRDDDNFGNSSRVSAPITVRDKLKGFHDDETGLSHTNLVERYRGGELGNTSDS